MVMKIYAVGGYKEIGKNMTVVESGEEAVVLDMGIHLEAYIKYTEDEDIENLSADELKKVGAIPDDSVVEMSLVASVSRESAVDDVFNTGETVEFDDEDAYAFVTSGIEDGIIRATLKMTSDANIISQIESAEFTTERKSTASSKVYFPAAVLHKAER